MVIVFANTEARADWAKPLRAALRLLGDTGIGGERSRGWGRSEAVEIEEGPLGKLLFSGNSAAGEPEATGYWLLSLYSPADTDQVDWSRGDYRLRTRAGRIESNVGWGTEKRLQRLVVEGSVVVAAKEPIGAARDVAPTGFAHPVYRNGHAIALPIAWKSAADRSLVPFPEPAPQPEPPTIVDEPQPEPDPSPSPEPELEPEIAEPVTEPAPEENVEGEGI